MKSKKCPKCGYVCSEAAPFCRGCGTSFPNSASMEFGGFPLPAQAPARTSESTSVPETPFANYPDFAPTPGIHKKLAQTSLALAFAGFIWSWLHEQIGIVSDVLSVVLLLASVPVAITALVKIKINPLLYGGKRMAQAALTICGLLLLIYGMAVPALITSRRPKPVNVAWQPFESEDGKFSIRMPGVAKHELKYFQTSDMGQVPWHNYMVDLQQKGVCLSGYVDFTGFRLMGSNDTFLDNSAEGAYQYGEMTIISKKNISLHGFEGRELLLQPNAMKYGANTFAIARIYLVYPRLYMTMVAGPNSSEIYQERFHYLDSFRTYSSPLIEAAEGGRAGLDKLIAESADEKEKEVAFVRAGRTGNQIGLRVMHDAGVSINARDDLGRTALMLAAAYTKTLSEPLPAHLIPARGPFGPSESTVDFLIGRGANLDAQDTDRQWTALIWSIEEGDGNAALALIKAGADVNLKDRNGETALAHAKKTNKLEVAEALKQAGARE